MNSLRKIPKVVVIGLDGATFKVIRPWIENGQLPNLKEIMTDGVHGELYSTIPPLSPQAWTSFMTGKNPGKHGIFDFTSFKPGTYDLSFSNANVRCGKSLWKILSEHKFRVGVVNVPMTYPPEPVNGFLISGMEAPGVHSNFIYPSGLYREIKAATGQDYDIHGDYWTNKSPGDYLKVLLETMDNQARAIKYLLKQHPADFFMAVFGSTDRVQHFYWKYFDPEHPHYKQQDAEQYGDAIFKVYQLADKILGEYLALIPGPKAVFIMSDHGAGPAKKVVYLDKWLADNGYLVWEKDRVSGKYAALKQLYLQLRKYSPRWFKDLMKAMFPQIREQVESNLILGEIDWSRTKAFTLGVESTPVFINTKDRFPQGIVSSSGSEYNLLCNRLISEISQICDPETGETIVERVYKRDEIYNGDQLAQSPDLIVIWKNHEYVSRRHYRDQNKEVVSSQLKSGVMGRLMALELTGCHQPEGILLASGPGIRKKKVIKNANLIDLFSTILYYMGLAIPNDVDGKILTNIFTHDFLAQHQPVFFSQPAQESTGQSGYQKDEEKIIAERLRNLGYLE